MKSTRAEAIPFAPFQAALANSVRGAEYIWPRVFFFPLPWSDCISSSFCLSRTLEWPFYSHLAGKELQGEIDCEALRRAPSRWGEKGKEEIQSSTQGGEN